MNVILLYVMFTVLLLYVMSSNIVKKTVILSKGTIWFLASVVKWYAILCLALNMSFKESLIHRKGDKLAEWFLCWMEGCFAVFVPTLHFTFKSQRSSFSLFHFLFSLLFHSFICNHTGAPSLVGKINSRSYSL